MNRSALIACLVLLEQGMNPEQAICRVRERREGSLSDEYADWLRTLQAGGRASGGSAGR